MDNTETYRILRKFDGELFVQFTPLSVAAFLLGKRVNEYIVIKSDNRGDRVVNFTDYDCHMMQEQLENA